MSFDINSHDTRIRSSNACRAPSGSPALERILALRVLPRRSIFDTPARELPLMNGWKMQFLQRDEDNPSSFCEELQGSRRGGHLGQMIKVTRDMVNFIISIVCSTAITWFRFRTSGNFGPVFLLCVFVSKGMCSNLLFIETCWLI